MSVVFVAVVFVASVRYWRLLKRKAHPLLWFLLLPVAVGCSSVTHATDTVRAIEHAKPDAGASGDVIYVGVAANFIAPMTELVERFEADSRHSLRVSYASSGKLFAQILHGAPFHLLLSADTVKPAALIQQQLAVPDSQYTYALGALALCSADSATSEMTASELAASGLVLKQMLISDNFTHLAIANPRLAPYGLAAQQVLQRLGIMSRIEDKLVRGENIAQAYQFVASGNAQLGFVARSQLDADSSLLTCWCVPKALYSPIRQDMVITKRGATHQPAWDFYRFLQSPIARGIITAHGYKTIEQD